MSDPFVAYMMAISFAHGVVATLIFRRLQEASRAHKAHREDYERRVREFHNEQKKRAVEAVFGAKEVE